MTAMPMQRRLGKRTLYLEVDERLGEAIEGLANQNRRTLTAEITLALEQHLAHQGVLIEPLAPPRPRGRPAKPKPADAAPPRPRGRPRKV